MDSPRFDALARSLATAKTRRGVLGFLAALGTGLLGARRSGAQVLPATQAQCGNSTCKNNPGKCNPGCVCCVYGNGNSRCRPPGTCSPGIEIGGGTTTTTAPPGCATSDQCGGGLTCVNGGCFRACPTATECTSCVNCDCAGRSDAAGRFCVELGYDGLCEVDSDCPRGLLCTDRRMGIGGEFGCKAPCCQNS